MKKILQFNDRHPLAVSIVLSMTLGFVMAVGLFVLNTTEAILADRMSYYDLAMEISGIFMAWIILGAFIVFPLVLTMEELWMLARVSLGREISKVGYVLDGLAVLLGVIYSGILLSVGCNVYFEADWEEQLYNAAVHTPIYTGSILTVAAIALCGIAGYGIVQCIPLTKTPPLLMVLGMSGMYLGTLESVVWGVQICKGISFHPFDMEWMLLLLPLNCVLITARAVLGKVMEWKRVPPESRRRGKTPFLRLCDHVLERSEYWPIAAFLLMWPLLGILIALLILLGQSPDAVIKAWTETAGWSLSQRTAPQNLYYDEHYLCTVAAGGHERVVKPLRLGVRHGHEVIVNRQLCIANAFEQMLEERTPRFHRAVRRFYDTYGFPVAKLIHSKYTADVVYWLMKPLEWIFLAVLYLTEVNPENRIAIQYTGRKLEDFGYGR